MLDLEVFARPLQEIPTLFYDWHILKRLTLELNFLSLADEVFELRSLQDPSALRKNKAARDILALLVHDEARVDRIDCYEPELYD